MGLVRQGGGSDPQADLKRCLSKKAAPGKPMEQTQLPRNRGLSASVPATAAVTLGK